MLKRLDEQDTKRLNNVLLEYPVFNVRSAGLLFAYGTKYSFFNIWHDDFKTIIAELEGNYFICESDETDYCEIKSFLDFCPNVISVGARTEILDKAGYCKNSSKAYNVMTLEKLLIDNHAEIDCSPKLKDVYTAFLNNQCEDIEVGEFEPWYADVSHRIRHGAAKAYTINSEEATIAALLVSAMSEKAGLISGVAVNKSARNKGFGSAIIINACKDLLKSGRTPIAECSEKLVPFYKRLGFKIAGTYKIIW